MPSSIRLPQKQWMLGFVGLVVALTASLHCRADAIDEIVKAQLANQKIPGAAILVLKDGKIAKAGAYGLADVERAIPVTTDTIFRIASVSKQFTATGVMMLVEAGKLSLDDSIGTFLSAAPKAWQPIKVRHLLSHTSGLHDFINESTVNLNQEATDEQLMASIANRPLKFEPGDAWDYNDTNYLLLGMIIRSVTGTWYGDFLAHRIFQPLGMTSTSIPRSREKLQSRATGYAVINGRVVPSPGDVSLSMSVGSYGGGGIQTTVLDLARWEMALQTERLLKRSTLEMMWTPVKLNNGLTHPYGFGWQLDDLAQHRRIWHGGSWIGFAAHIDRFVDDRLTVIILTNLSESAPARIARAVAAVYVPTLAAPLYRSIADKEPETTARFFDLLRRTELGTLHASEFTEPGWAYIGPRIEQMKRDFSLLGDIQKLTLVERTMINGERSYRYNSQFSRTTMVFHFVLTKEGQVSVMMPELVNE